MATFPENLETIRTAVLGEDMREAIHDAVEQAYDHGGEIVLDDVPVSGSNNPVKSGGLYTTLAGKVNTVSGKGLSTNDYTNAEKAKVAEIDNKQDSLEFDIMPIEDSDNPVKSGGIYTDTQITRNMIASIEKGENISKTYGVRWDYSSPSTVLTRIEDAADFNNPSPATSLNAAGSSPFDDIYPWSEMKRYNIINGAVSYSEDDAGYSETAYDTVVYIPEFYYFSKKDTTNQKWTWSISPIAIEGYEKHPGSGRYVGRFHSSGGGTTMFSKSLATPRASLSRANFRTYSHNKGANWWQIDIATWSAIQMLYLIEYANWNSQSALGDGQNTGNVANTGATTGAAYHTVKRSGASNTYRWIENPFSNVMTWIDGYVSSDKASYVGTNPAGYGDTISGMENVGITLSNTGYISGMGYSEKCAWAFIPDTASGGETTYVTDYMLSNSGVCGFYVGGNASTNLYFGFFYFNAYNSASNSGGTSHGSRLIYIPS